jgi:threonine synthase
MTTQPKAGKSLLGIVCSHCGNKYPLDSPSWKCSCGAPLDLLPAPPLKKSALDGRPFGLWRYLAALPAFEEHEIVTLGEGLTPLVDARPRSGLKYKLDFLMPTGSFKDRGTTVLVSQLKRMGVTRIVEDSSGNAGASMAAYCSAAGIPCDIYVPAKTSPNKTRQIRAYGARLVLVDGSREDVASAAEAAGGSGAHYASHAWSPFFLAGTSTIAYEIWDQLGWKVPDNLIVPAGAGTLVLGVYLAFSHLMRSGLTDRMPRLFAVQAENCAPLYHAWRRGAPSVEGWDCPLADTVAEGIRIQRPVRSRQILNAVRETGGDVLAISEGAIVEAWFKLANRGLFIEPTSAVVAAAADRMIHEGSLSEKELTIAVLTGTGLKGIDKSEEGE